MSLEFSSLVVSDLLRNLNIPVQMYRGRFVAFFVVFTSDFSLGLQFLSSTLRVNPIFKDQLIFLLFSCPRWSLGLYLHLGLKIQLLKTYRDLRVRRRRFNFLRLSR